MVKNLFKSLLLLAFGLVSFTMAIAQGEAQKLENTKKGAAFDPSSIIMEHISDDHSFHFFNLKGKAYSAPLPIIIYSPQKGFHAFMSSEFEHGEKEHDGFRLVNEAYMEKMKEEKQLNIGDLSLQKIIAVNAEGMPDSSVKVYDFSMTRNVVQMLLALALLVIVMMAIAKKYKKNGSSVAPSGFQNAMEPIITFVRDEVAKPNLGHSYLKYTPFLLTTFFFILINNIVGLVPGTANVTGNIAFTLVLGVISFIVIMFSTNRHFWGHIFWPPGVPWFVKIILIPVEFLGIFTKPVALIVRLFANMVAGHIIITCFILLIFIFGAMSTSAGVGFAPVSLAFTVFIYFIEILVAFLQAYIFTNLTAVFIGQAMEAPHHEEKAHV